MRRITWILWALAALALAAPVGAEEIIHFKSGSAMPIVSHEIEGDMIHVDLGDNAFMAFPISMVDRVEKAGKNVMLRRSNTGGTNVMRVRPNPTGSFPVQGSQGSRSADNRRFPEEREPDPSVEVDDKGVAVYRPLAHSSHPGKRSLAVTGHRRVRENSGTPGSYRGARQIGNKQVMGSAAPRRRQDEKPPEITGIEFRNQPLPPARAGSRGGQRDSDSSDSGSDD